MNRAPTNRRWNVYQCPVRGRHFHIGKAVGERAEVLRRRAEKLKRRQFARFAEIAVTEIQQGSATFVERGVATVHSLACIRRSAER